MIDEAKKAVLKKAFFDTMTPERCKNYRRNLELENVPLCGKRAMNLPYVAYTRDEILNWELDDSCLSRG